MNLGPHPVAKRSVNALVPKHPALAGELGRDDGGEEVMAIALDLEMVARQSCGDEATHVVSSWVSHVSDYRRSKCGFDALYAAYEGLQLSTGFSALGATGVAPRKQAQGLSL
jgi:hypothetical protein